MRNLILTAMTAAAAALLAGRSAVAQTYSNAVMGLNPVGYWPLNETVAPPQPVNLTATNLGTLGTEGNGSYGAWYQPSGNTWYLTNNIVQTSGATADGDKALNCQFAPGQYIILPRNTNGVPNAAITINAPFSIETWVKVGTTAAQLGDMISEGSVQLDAGGPNTNNPFYGGIGGTVWAGFELGQYQNFFFFSCFNTNAYNTKASELDSPKTLVVGQWVHLVCTFDGTVETMYENGTQVGQKTVPANAAGLRYVPDPTSPLMIGAGGVPAITYGVAFTGALDEVAIYPEVLPQSSILAHYQTAGGTNTTYGANYANAVLADNPMIYYRMDDPVTRTNAGYPSLNFPVANNYGSAGAAANGVYQPGTTPGVPGPNYAGFGANNASVAINGWLGAVDVGSSNLPVSLNPTGRVPVSVVSWFQTGPADSPGRFQNILGHSDLSYRMALGQTGGGGDMHFNPGPGPELLFTSPSDVVTNGFAFNDGQWHMIAGVSDGTNEFLYLDGVLAKTNGNATGINIIGTNRDLLLGADTEYTLPSVNTANTIRNFDGQIAQIAFWTNALSPTQIQTLYGAAAVPPYLWQEPAASVTINALQNLIIPVGVRGSAPLSYQWYQNGSPVAGQTNAALNYSPVATGNAGNYLLVAHNSAGSVTSSIVNVTVYGPPTVAQQTPAQLNIFAGASPVLHVTAVGAVPIRYQWTLNSVPITGATNASFTLTNFQASATYGCLMTNSVGTGAITPIVATVLTDPTAPYPSQVLLDGPLAYYRLDETGGTTAYDYVGGNNATYTNVLLDVPGYNSQSDPTETAAEFGAENPPNDYAGNVPSYVNFGAPNGSNAEFSVEGWVTQYLYDNGGDAIVALGYGNGGEQFVLDTGAGAAGDLRFLVRNVSGTVSSASSTISINNDGLWHHVVGVCDEAGGHVYLYLDGRQVASATITPGSGLLSSSTPLSIGARQSGNNNNTNYDFQLYGSVDDVALYNKALSAAQVQAHYFGSGLAPVITGLLPTSNLTTNQSANVVLTVSASGTAPLAYQWTDNNGSPIASGTNATLVLSDIQPSQAGYYTVSVTNLYGGPVTTNVLLTITQAPQIVSDISPANVTVYATTPVTLSVTMSGTPPLSYQWYQNGVVVPGATNTTYSFAALPGSNNYYLSVTNIYSAGTPTVSSTATVVGMPVVTLNPTNYTDNMKITFAGYNRTETLSDFPVLVEFSTALSGFNYGHFASPTGGDLRFTDSGGTRVLPYEIDQWNPNGVSTVWVQVPTLSSTNNFIWAYWGNSTNTTPLPGTNVWVPQPWEGLPAYDVVYHLKENGFPFADSTGQNPALNGVAPTPTTGIVGTGESFNGTNFLDAGTNINVGNAFTVSAWVNMSPTASNIQGVWASKAGGSSSGFGLFINAYQTVDEELILETGNGSATPTLASPNNAVSSGQWHLVSAVINRAAGLGQLYVDGVAQTDSGSMRNDFGTNSDINLGQLLNGGFPFNGGIDEARIQSGTNSASWLWASWMTVAQNSSLESYSTVASTAPAGPVAVKVQFTSGNLNLSGSGGTAGAPYYVIGSTNLLTPMSQWTPVSTNMFDSNGNFNVNVPVNVAMPTLFLRIKQ